MYEQEHVDREDVDSIGALAADSAVPSSRARRQAQPRRQQRLHDGPPRQIRIFDTTLRDGEQSPGASMTIDEKLEVAAQLIRLGVDIIEAGFPAASSGELAAVREIARSTHGPAIAALARADRADIDACYEALRDAERPVLHVFIATSDLHLKHKLGKTREEVLAQIEEMVSYAHRGFEAVEFSAEDATRSDWNYLSQAFAAAIRAGASVVNVPDTVGYTTPGEYTALIAHLRAAVPGIDGVTLSAHCHDDLGMATANTLAAIASGAGQVEVTINGLGERAGNTSLEEVVMALRTRADAFGGCTTRIVTEQLVASSQLVSRITGVPVPPNKAIVGANAFSHEAGIHQDGMLKHRGTYEIMEPHTVGWTESRLVLGKHSGRHGFDARLRTLGYRLRREELQRAYEAFVAHVDQHKHAGDDVLRQIVETAHAVPVAQPAGA
ncbi:MAG TPA: 2-isopropylmalate synthase [Ktedonobacterales bacterium]|jgi:2-isopropylmalate synthase|nr:2-isopropylmalate synthase [Ktedonobacterales bacterium]